MKETGLASSQFCVCSIYNVGKIKYEYNQTYCLEGSDI